jgi:hypothetical protein
MIDSYGRIWKDQTAKWEERAAAGAVWARRLLVPFKASPVRKPSAILVLVSWLVLAIAIGATTVKEMSGQVAYDHGDYPVVATDYVLAHPGTCLRIYNEYGWGGYMVYRLYPSEHRVYIFGEAALEGDQHLNEYEDVAGLASNWQQLLSQAQVDCVVFPKVSGLASTLKVDPQWKLVHEDNVADIFVRN